MKPKTYNFWTLYLLLIIPIINTVITFFNILVSAGSNNVLIIVFSVLEKLFSSTTPFFVLGGLLYVLKNQDRKCILWGFLGIIDSILPFLSSIVAQIIINNQTITINTFIDQIPSFIYYYGLTAILNTVVIILPFILAYIILLAKPNMYSKSILLSAFFAFPISALILSEEIYYLCCFVYELNNVYYDTMTSSEILSIISSFSIAILKIIVGYLIILLINKSHKVGEKNNETKGI